MERCEWDFKSREAFVQWAEATFQYWTRHLPDEAARDTFIRHVLDAYRALGDGSEAQANLFVFYQMKASLSRPA